MVATVRACATALPSCSVLVDGPFWVGQEDSLVATARACASAFPSNSSQEPMLCIK